jgi:NADH-quinone oxidoreductase subunit G
VLVVGSNLRKDHPLFAQRIRQAVRKGGKLSQINEIERDWAMPVAHSIIAPVQDWAASLSDPRLKEWLGTPDVAAGQKIILLGNAAAHHANASALLALANELAAATGAAVGYLTEAANTVGAQLCNARSGTAGLNAGQMLNNNGQQLKAALLLGCEPAFDSAAGAAAVASLAQSKMVISLNAFKANMDCADVLLPIAPFTETSGTFVNAEGREQSFHAVVKPLGETRPAWKVLRVLGNLLDLPGFDYDTSQAVWAESKNAAPAHGALVAAEKLSNASSATAAVSSAATTKPPCVAGIYQLDGLVRRAPSLQLTADAQQAMSEGVAA